MSQVLFDQKQYAAKAREAAAEGIVLLRNEAVRSTGRPSLPFAAGTRVAVFGRNQLNYYKSGTGSGGMVNTPYTISPIQAMLDSGTLLPDETVQKAYQDFVLQHPYEAGSGWASEPWFQEEMPLEPAFVQAAAMRCDAAIVMIGRTAGEDQDNSLSPGSLLLTDREESMLEQVCGAFDNTVVLLNVGNIIDMSWLDHVSPQAVLYIWQGGMEGGNAVLDVLTGRVAPSGRLPDTIAKRFTDYPASGSYGDPVRNCYREDIYVGYRYFETFHPEQVRFPFGFGLSYTTFDLYADLNVVRHRVVVSASIENTGDADGRETLQVYVEKPQGRLGQPVRQLAGFAKTPLLKPGQGTFLQMVIPLKRLASFDDSGAVGFARNSWVLEEGSYVFYAGTDVRNAIRIGSVEITEDRLISDVEDALAPELSFQRIRPGQETVLQGIRRFGLSEEAVPVSQSDQKLRRFNHLPAAIAQTGDRGFRLRDVAEGRCSLEEFTAQLEDRDLIVMMRGEGMSSSRVTGGTAGAFGGVTDRLEHHFGIPAGCCSDGPSGIRMDSGALAFLMPCGTLLASTFNEKLVSELYAFEGMELRRNHIDTLLGPGINIHRHPLNGRNFEYFSEDPYLTGRMAAAELSGMHRFGVTGTIKHFAANSQEKARSGEESVVSARALREIYLKPFEIAVKEGHARSVMTSYNALNGTWNASNYDLITTILRREWGFDGLVMTDWWAHMSAFGGSPSREDVAAMVRAGGNLYMVSGNPEVNGMGDNLDEAFRTGNVTRGELQQAAMTTLRFLLQAPCMLRKRGILTVTDRALAEGPGWENREFQLYEISIDAQGWIDTDAIRTARGSMNQVCVPLSAEDTQPDQFFLNERARHYHFVTEVCAAEGTPSLAQLSMTVYRDRYPVKTIVIDGAQQAPLPVDVELPDPAVQKNFLLRLYFGTSGMNIINARIIRR